MKYYRDNNNEVYAYNDNEQPLQSGLTLIEETEVTEILTPKVDEKEQKELNEMRKNINLEEDEGSEITLEDFLQNNI